MWGALMDQLVTIKRNTVTQDALGGRVFVLADVLTKVPCAIQSAGSTEEYYWQRRGIVCDDEILTENDLDTTISGGLKVNDVIVDSSGIQRAVTGSRRDLNLAISPDPIYQIATVRVKPAT